MDRIQKRWLYLKFHLWKQFVLNLSIQNYISGSINRFSINLEYKKCPEQLEDFENLGEKIKQ